MSQAFGEALKHWRQQRRLSQLDLSVAADVSSRHLSFLETGRARPSRGMVLRLCERLDVPLAATNQLLTAAGMAPAYGHRTLSDADMVPVRQAVAWMLHRHSPYPALALDRYWTLLDVNDSAAALLGAVGVTPGDSMIEAFTSNQAARQSLENWDEVMRHIVARLRTERSHVGGDPVLDRAIATIEAALAPQTTSLGALRPAFVPARYRVGQTVLSLFSTIAQFGSAEDIALADLRIELMFPADDCTRQALHALALGDAASR